ncbi:serine protease [Candidatus Uhrbacteria bacterium]|nr:serine protease [Candidatus Uhrbacteria bacterium]
MKFFSWYRVLAGAIILGTALLGGAFAGWMTSQNFFSMRWNELVSSLPERFHFFATTSTPAQLISVEREPLASLYPSSFASRRLSPLALLVRRSGVKISLDHLVTALDHPLGGAVALTSDGWLVTVNSALVNLPMNDLLVIWNRRAYPVMQAIRDAATGAVFVKIDAKDLPAAEFVSAQDVAAGAAVWFESSPKEFYPSLVVSVQDRSSVEVMVSEHVARRFLLSGTEAHIPGSAVWDGRGRLVGLVDAKAVNGWQVLPASTLEKAFASLLAQREIRHAFLGVRVLDLSDVALEAKATSSLPLSGAWLHADRLGMPVILPTSPAAKFLREGDVISAVERDILDGTADLGERLLEYPPGAEITLHGLRQGKDFQVTLKLGSLITSEKLK